MNKTIKIREVITLDFMYKEMEKNIRNFSQINDVRFGSNPASPPEALDEEEYINSQLKNLEELKGIFDSLFTYFGLEHPDVEKIIIKKTDNNSHYISYDIHLDLMCLSISTYAGGPLYRVGQIEVNCESNFKYDVIKKFLIKALNFDRLYILSYNMAYRDESSVKMNYDYNDLKEVGNLFPDFTNIVIELLEILISNKGS